MIRAAIPSTAYRLLLPFLLSLILIPLVQAQETPRPVLSCRLDPSEVPFAGDSLFILELRNAGGINLDVLNLQVEYTNTDAIEWQDPALDGNLLGQEAGGNFLLPLLFENPIYTPGTLKVTATRANTEPISSSQGVLATGRVRALQQTSLITFTLPAGGIALRNDAGVALDVTISPTCFLAIGGAELPTATMTVTETPTPTHTTISVLGTPTPSATVTPTPSVTVSSPLSTPTIPAPTQTATITPPPTATATLFLTPTPSATATVLVVSSPTVRVQDLQSPVQTPVPTSTRLDLALTPDIALTLTAEALETLLPIDPQTEIPTDEVATATPEAELPLESPTPSATPTPTAIEVLSPPRLEEAPLPSLAEQAAISGIAERVADRGDAAAMASLDSLVVERIQQPAASARLARRPTFQIVGWTAFVGGVVLVLTSWWIRRRP